jgi:hypothetical protein
MDMTALLSGTLGDLLGTRTRASQALNNPQRDAPSG